MNDKCPKCGADAWDSNSFNCGNWMEDGELVQRPRCRIRELEAEVQRLKRGDFTFEEFQRLCHNRDEYNGCTKESFFQGCHEYQVELFGKSERQQLEAENQQLREEVERLSQRTVYDVVPLRSDARAGTVIVHKEPNND